MVAEAVLKGALFVSGLGAVLGVYGLWLWGRSQRTKVSLAATARAAWDDCAPESARLLVEIDDDLAVSADPEKLEGLFEAMFENSIEYAGRDVTVRLSRTADGFAVDDDGPGVPAGERERIFDPGYSTRADRAGMGLVLVRTLCQAYGWDVAVTDGEEGARFVVSNVRFYSSWEGGTDAAGEPAGGASA
ncbi:sensor histidine kinase [Halorientalis halophila]|uniref:sensor histidine kinase n=1 Tax=Halorientalis halophila TaxID=3108499 RepID=UPI0030091DF0